MRHFLSVCSLSGLQQKSQKIIHKRVEIVSLEKWLWAPCIKKITISLPWSMEAITNNMNKSMSPWICSRACILTLLLSGPPGQHHDDVFRFPAISEKRKFRVYFMICYSSQTHVGKTRRHCCPMQIMLISRNRARLITQSLSAWLNILQGISYENHALALHLRSMLHTWNYKFWPVAKYQGHRFNGSCWRAPLKVLRMEGIIGNILLRPTVSVDYSQIFLTIVYMCSKVCHSNLSEKQSRNLNVLKS